jgi:ADP-ribose pyrophosphatase
MTLKRHPDVELLDSKLIHAGYVFHLRHETLRLPSGLEQKMEVVDHPGAVAIVATNEAGELLLVRQYRHALGDWVLELPAGRLEPGEDPLVAAQRELEEETGFRAGSWEPLRELVPAPGFCSEVIHVFRAHQLQAIPGGGLEPDADEEIELRWLSPEDVLASEIRDAKTLLAALWLREPQS